MSLIENKQKEEKNEQANVYSVILAYSGLKLMLQWKQLMEHVPLSNC